MCIRDSPQPAPPLPAAALHVLHPLSCCNLGCHEPAHQQFMATEKATGSQGKGGGDGAGDNEAQAAMKAQQWLQVPRPVHCTTHMRGNNGTPLDLK
eukprot:4992482-Alexandrium_andersonii.AAC.1